MRILRQPSALGAEVTDVDVRALSQAEFEEIKAAWHEHLVLIFRDQELSPEDQLQFARRFGELGSVANRPPGSPVRDRFVMNVTNLVLDDARSSLPDGEMFFHFDTCYFAEPYGACFLYALRVPGHGGETLFGNMIKAYEELPGDLKKAVAGKLAVNAYDYSTAKNERKEPRADAPRFAHPIVVEHPDTQANSLFVNRLMTFAIVGADRATSDSILERLFDHAEAPEFIYPHLWRVGDLVLWDNRCVSHARTWFDPAEPRHLRRVSVRGTRPVAARR